MLQRRPKCLEGVHFSFELREGINTEDRGWLHGNFHLGWARVKL